VQLIIGAAAERPADLAVAENVAAQLTRPASTPRSSRPPASSCSARRPSRPPRRAPRTPRRRPRRDRPRDAGTPSPLAPRRPRRPPRRTRPRAPAAGSASTSWSGRGPSAATRPPSSPRTTAATTRHPERPPRAPSVPTTCSSALQPLLDELLADPTAAPRRHARGRREAAVVAGPGAAAVPAGVAAREHRERGRRDRRRPGPADHRAAHRCPALDATATLTVPIAEPRSVVTRVSIVARKVTASRRDTRAAVGAFGRGRSR
jgi:hypothetical protein